MCQAFTNGPIQQRRRGFDSVSSVQSNKKIKKPLFQLKYDNLTTLHYLSTFVFLLQIRDSIPNIIQVSIEICGQGF